MRHRRYTKRNLAGSFLSNLSITGWIILINIVFFVFAMFLLAYNESLLEYIALKPTDILQGKNLWTLVTHMFMHGGFFHLLINMFVLFNLGKLMEKIIGRKRFLWF